MRVKLLPEQWQNPADINKLLVRTVYGELVPLSSVTKITEEKKLLSITREMRERAINIYAKAFGQDEQFFVFYRSLQAYRDALNGHDTSFVLAPDSNFFRFFNNGPAGAPAQAAAPTPNTPPSPAPAAAK